jgi:hypothetical protein
MEYSLTPEQIENRFSLLSERLKEVLVSPETSQKIDLISEQAKLNDIDNFSLRFLTGLVILGFVFPKNITGEIQDGLNIEKEKADSISKEILQKIINPLKNDLLVFYQKIAAGNLPDTSPSSPPTQEKPAVMTPPPKTPPLLKPSFLEAEKQGAGSDSRQTEKTVNYSSEFSTSPLVSTENPTKGQPDKNPIKVNPENTVDLKDLPK